MDFLQALNDASIPSILVVAGILFIFLSIAGGISSNIKVPISRQKQSAITGSIMLTIGLVLSLVPNNNHQPNSTDTAENSGAHKTPVNKEEKAGEKTKDEPAQTKPQPEPPAKSILETLPIWPEHYAPNYFRTNKRWKTGEWDTADYYVKRSQVNGRPVMYLYPKSSDRYIVTELPINPLQNFDISAKFTWMQKSKDKECVGLTFRDSGNSFYLYYLCDNGGVGFNRYSKNQDPKWKTYKKATLYENVSDTSNTLRVFAQDDKMLFIVNGELVLSMKDSTPQSGNIELYLDASKKSVAEIRVDEISVRVPPL